MSLPYHIAKSDRAAVSRRWHEAKARKRMARGADADTVRMRALWDAKGTVLREGCTYFGDGRIVPWHVRRSVAGRTDQYDVLAGGEVWRTAGPRKLPQFIRP